VQAEDEAGALTPGHFLTGERQTAITTGPEPKKNGGLTKEFSFGRDTQTTLETVTNCVTHNVEEFP